MEASDGRSVLPVVYQIQELQKGARPSLDKSRTNSNEPLPSPRAGLTLQRSMSDNGGQTSRTAAAESPRVLPAYASASASGSVASPRQSTSQKPSLGARFLSIFVYKKPTDERGAAANDPLEEKGEFEDEEESDYDVEHSDIGDDGSNVGFERNDARRSARARKLWRRAQKVTTTIKAVNRFSRFAAEVDRELKETYDGGIDPKIFINTTFVDHETYNPGEGRHSSRGSGRIQRYPSLPEVTFTHRCRIQLLGVTNLHEYADWELISRDPYVRMVLEIPDGDGGERTKVFESTKAKDTTDPVWDPPVGLGPKQSHDFHTPPTPTHPTNPPRQHSVGPSILKKRPPTTPTRPQVRLRLQL